MAEKRRGLGRGLGALIPDVVKEERPVDVFFGGDDQSRNNGKRKSNDPAQSMMTARAKKKAPARKPAGGSSRGTTGAASKAETTAKSDAKPGIDTAGSTSAGDESKKAPATRKTRASRTSTAASAESAKSDKHKTPPTPESTPAKSTTSSDEVADTKSRAKRAASAVEGKEGASAAKKTAPGTSTTRSARSTSKKKDVNETQSTDSDRSTKTPSSKSNEAPSRDASTVSDSAAVRAEEQEKPKDASLSVSEGLEDLDPTNDSSETSRGAQKGDEELTSGSAAVDPTAGGTSVSAAEFLAESDVSRETSEVVEDSGTSNLVPVPGTSFGELSVESIRPNPRQPRTVFDEEALEELVTSIKEVGILQPVVVRPVDDVEASYELIMGERRFRAAQEAGLTEIPAIIREVRDDDLLRDALLENLHRSDLNPLEEAAAYQQLLDDFSCTQEELSKRIGRSRPQISNTLRLLNLPALVQRRVAAGVISQGHARSLLALKDPGDMEILAQRVVAEGLSVRSTEEAVVLLNRGDSQTVSRETKKQDPQLDSIARSIGDRLDTRVSVTMGKRKGKISVEFANQDDLDRILQELGVDRSSIS